MEIFTKIRLIGIFFFMLTFSTLLKAQETGSYWQVDYSKGSIIEHKKLIAFLFKENPTILSLGWHKHASNTSVWKERYNFLDWGIVLNYQDFHNENLGKTIGLNYTTTHYLLNRNNKNQLNIQLGFGVGYNTAPLDFKTNLTNVVMSSHILFSQHTKINYTVKNLFKNIGFQTGITFTHFSNGATKKPNFGLNTIFVNAGFNYLSNDKSLTYKRFKVVEPFVKQPIHLKLSLAAGIHETLPQIGLKPIYYFSAQASKRINYKNGFHTGLDFFISYSRKELAKYHAVNNLENPNSPIKDHKQIAVFAGHEWYFDRISFETRMGYYLYQPLKSASPIYEIVAFKWNFKESKSAVIINLKTHFFEAAHVTFGYQYQIF